MENEKWKMKSENGEHPKNNFLFYIFNFTLIFEENF